MRKIILLFVSILLSCSEAFAIMKGGIPFNPLTDIHWKEINFQIEGVCECPRPPPIFVEPGIIISYWEPFLLIDTVATPNYSPFLGMSIGASPLDMLGGKNNSSSAADYANESTFAQAHAYLLPLMPPICNRFDYGMWWSELDPMWQSDELSMFIHPEAALYANKAMQLACMADATAVNIGMPLDFMPWCVGSGGSTYPMTGHVDNDNIVQANNTVAARMIAKLNRLGLICDPAINLCGCFPTPVWIKSHYKLHPARPGNRWPAYPVGKSANFYATGLNPPFFGEMGPNDEFLWVVYRKQRCCTCCQ